jgi:predicted RNA binding protein YcfA (HicA-like mRNA interferase family)
MPRLPVISGREAIRVFERTSYRIARQRGSQVRLHDDQDEKHQPLTIPNHKRLKPGLLGSLIRDANLTVDEFIALSRRR